MLEGCLRLALFSEWLAVDWLRSPGLYANFDQDDYWKLHLRWSGFSGFRPGWYHPLLGELIPRTEANPLGLLEPRTRFPDPDSREPVVLFYGDSYLASPLAQQSSRIPALLEDRLEGLPVLNFGMGGYGLDQIVLRFETTNESFRNPRILIGILTGDVDRCVLSVRQGQKPRYVIREDGTLQLTNVPIERDQAAYLSRNPPQVRSWVLLLARITLSRSRLAQAVPALRSNDRAAEKTKIGRALIERVVTQCRKRRIPLCFLIFYNSGALEWPTWPETFLRDTFDRIGACYLDTKPVLRSAVSSGRLSRDDLFDRETAHHTGLANEVIVDELVRRWGSIELAIPDRQ